MGFYRGIIAWIQARINIFGHTQNQDKNKRDQNWIIVLHMEECSWEHYGKTTKR